MAVYKSGSIDIVMYKGQEISKIYVGTELFWPVSEGSGGSDKPIIPDKEITSITFDSVAVDTLTWKGGTILYTYNYTFTFSDGSTSNNVLGATVSCNKETISQSSKKGRRNKTEHELTFTLTYKDQTYGTITKNLIQYGVPVSGLTIESANSGTTIIPYEGLNRVPSYSVDFRLLFADGTYYKSGIGNGTSDLTENGITETVTASLDKYKNSVPKSTSKDQVTLVDTVTVTCSGFTDTSSITFTQKGMPITSFDILTPASKIWRISWRGGTITAFSSDAYKIQVKAIYDDGSYDVVSDESNFTFTTRSKTAGTNTKDKEVVLGSIVFKVSYKGYTSEDMYIRVVQDATELIVYAFTKLSDYVDTGFNTKELYEAESAQIEYQGQFGTDMELSSGTFYVSGDGGSNRFGVSYRGSTTYVTFVKRYDRLKLTFDSTYQNNMGIIGELCKDNGIFTNVEGYETISYDTISIKGSYFTCMKIWLDHNLAHNYVGCNLGLIDTVTGNIIEFEMATGVNSYLRASQLEFGTNASYFKPTIIPKDGGTYPSYSGSVLYNILLPKTSTSSSAQRTMFQNLYFDSDLTVTEPASVTVGANPKQQVRDLGTVTVKYHTGDDWGYNFDYDYVYTQQQEAGDLPLDYMNAKNILYASISEGLAQDVTSEIKNLVDDSDVRTIGLTQGAGVRFNGFALANTDMLSDITRLQKSNINLYNMLGDLQTGNMTFTVAAQTWKYVNFGTTRFGRGSNVVGSSTYTAKYSFGFGYRSIYSNVYIISGRIANLREGNILANILRGYNTEYTHYKFEFKTDYWAVYEYNEDSKAANMLYKYLYNKDGIGTVVILKYPCKLYSSGIGEGYIYGPDPSNIINFSK